VAALSQQGIACFAFGPDKVRLVTHLDVHAAQLEEACERLGDARWPAS
jgi:threonine aldolase